ncbi:MAG TPA: hypothetical protein VF283_22565 [Bryobacteraceae bacterium]
MASGTETRLDQAYNDMYNLQFDAAHRVIAQYKALWPLDPLGPVSDAAACLFSEFNRLHILQSEFFVNNQRFFNFETQRPDPAVRARFDEDLEKTRRLAALQLKSPEHRANAMLAQTLQLGLRADYLALIDRRNWAALAETKKARILARQLLAKHPQYYDAYIAMGIENYLLSQKPAPVRWILRMTGARTDKQRGIEELKLTAEHGHYLKPYARLLLAVAALRDGNRKKARELLGWLAARYPKNRLYRKELAKLQ